MAKQKANKSKSKQTNSNSKSRSNKTQSSRSSSNASGTNTQAEAADDATFRLTLASLKLSVTEIDPDGNCLFRSLSDQLYHDNGSQHLLVRNEICNHLSSHRSSFECFLLMNDEDEDIVDFDEYVSKMREDGEWGGNVELVAASRVYRRDVRIYSGLYDGGVMLIKYQPEEEKKHNYDEKGKKQKGKKSSYKQYDEVEGDCDGNGIVYFGDLFLSYHENDHYNSVHLINDTSSDRGPNDSKTSLNENDTPIKEGTSTSSMSLTMKSNRKPKKGDQCPCGSGKKYKKCCSERDKALSRAAKLKEDIEDEKKDDVNDRFKVLTI